MNNKKNQNSKSKAILLQRSQMSQYFQCPYKGHLSGKRAYAIDSFFLVEGALMRKIAC